MADALKPEFKLLSLRVGLIVEHNIRRLEFRLEYHGGEHAPELEVWTEDAALLESPSETDIAPHIMGIGRRVAGTLALFSVPSVPLWLHLVKPYGSLGGFL